MLVRNATHSEVEKALKKTTERYGGNVVFKRCDHAGYTRKRDPKYTVTLTVKSSREPGARRAPGGRRLAAACWHAHGLFMDALPEDSEIVVNWTGGRRVISPGDEWQDSDAGSQMRPVKFSALCDCVELGLYSG
jgi:hypothetical protein